MAHRNKKNMEQKIKNSGSLSRRVAGEMRPVLANLKKINPKKIVYDVYRGAYLWKDEKIIDSNDLRYDITHLYPNRLNKELSKTFGHYHKNDFPEIMEVLSGPAWFIMQRYGKNYKNIKEAYLIKAKTGDKIIIPPKFGLASLNPFKKTVILANWLSVKIKNNYQPYEKLRGACYYFIREKNKIAIVKNKNYKTIPDLIEIKPKEIAGLDLLKSKSLYSLIEHPKILAFLNNPKKFKNLLTIQNCYDRF